MTNIHPEYQYLNLLEKIVAEGSERVDRTGVGTKALFGEVLRFDLADGFPAFTTKRVYWKTAFKEMIWMLQGKSEWGSGNPNIRDLLEQNVHIWSEWPHKKYVDFTGDKIELKEFEERIIYDDEFAAKWGDLGPVYGKQWRAWKTEDGREIDQVSEVIDQIKNNPTSRRIIFDGWNVGELDHMALPPCHKHYQFFVDQEKGTLSGSVVQRSGDEFLGVPFNVCNLAFITTLLAEQTGYKPGEIVWYGLDVHVYLNHLEQVKEQLSREPKDFPKLIIKNKRDSLFDYVIDDFDLDGYDPHPVIKAPVAV
ncbi:MAG: thymidylate synthase [Gammaproteobacteria bacterium]|nr:thymidylate synthase [Gammaproteobacteria bacterium]MBL7003008.1 thymidylate synthase [Gammaproteobacteria bacterium]